MKVVVQYKTLPETALNSAEVSTMNKKLIDWAGSLQNFSFFNVKHVEPKDQEIVIEVSYLNKVLTWQILTDIDEQTEKFIADIINQKK